MPKGLAGEARAEWRRIVPELEGVGTLAKVDRAALIRYCTVWADWCDLNVKLSQTGPLVRRREGFVRNPLWMMRSDAEATLSDLSKQLGLTPNSRRPDAGTQRKGNMSNGDDDELAKFRSRRTRRAAHMDAASS